MTTYHCFWCGWNGKDVAEQKAGNRYVCCRCGQDVKPGPHDTVAYGKQRARVIP